MVTSPYFSCSADVFAWIARFINMGRGQSFKSFRLDRMRVLCDLAGNPERSAPSIHVAGSKGKGSVTGMVTAILEAAGYKTARYTSPDVMEKRERITVGNRFFVEDVDVEAGRELAAVAGKLPALSGAERRLFDPDGKEGEEVTFFELMTLYFFLCARFSHCDAMAVETGMGGRLDATNIVDPLATVITLIELEHTEILGNTLGAIAKEKAGIIKAHTPLILSAQEPEALEVFRKETRAKDAPLLYFPETAELRDIRVSKAGTQFILHFLQTPLFPTDLRLAVRIPGEVQAMNAGLAVLAAKRAFPRITTEAIKKGLESFSLPARFEQIKTDPELVIDGAHTPKSMEQCCRTFRSLYGEGGILIFGCAEGKNAGVMAEILAPCFSRIIITTPGTFKKSNPEDLYRIFREKIQGTTELLLIPDTAAAIDRALEVSRTRGANGKSNNPGMPPILGMLPILGTGSFYLASEIRKYILAGA
ncbi:MAG: bifunctional folylpolyglutamate synthase/dihydrofolate synthase [Treponema sp.]|jgi:dihydrofolate synthase/folylpolyglutamate synthase|nr:bifunctional folylpolyglutamate synthase/dihydrofolate synthase [Treponema sp.]